MEETVMINNYEKLKKTVSKLNKRIRKIENRLVSLPEKQDQQIQQIREIEEDEQQGELLQYSDELENKLFYRLYERLKDKLNLNEILIIQVI